MRVKSPDRIRIRGARVHNLKNINLDFPRNSLVAVCGLSGSGKSSLAFDTLYAEGQRRYVESLSAYARQFLDQMAKPDVDVIEGLSPAISIEQKSISHNPRSTVGTVTEIYDYLRLLYARIGKPHCPSCRKPITSQTAQEIVDQILHLPQGTRYSVLAPMVRDRKGEHKKMIEDLRRSGYTRVNLDGEIFDLDEDIKIDPKKNHTLEVYIDRLVAKPGIRTRLADSIEIALKLADGIVKIAPVGGEDIVFSERHACLQCGLSLPEISPRFFSFNNPQGACSKCDGLGSIRFVDPELVVPDPEISINAGAIVPLGPRKDSYYWQMLEAAASHYKIDLDLAYKQLSVKLREILLYGSGKQKLKFDLGRNGMSHKFHRSYEGVITNLERRYRETQSEGMREEIDQFMTMKICSECGGKRLRKESLSVLVDGLSIADFTELSIKRAMEFLSAIDLEHPMGAVAERILREIRSRLKFMVDVGLDYLTLDRGSSSLSGGEAQRIRLATQIGSALTGVLYVLDEPTIGLHPRDCSRLLDTLKDLRDRGNSVVVVEHDPITIMESDYVVDMGPGAGKQGGEVVARGTPKEIMETPESLTGAYLTGKLQIPVPKSRRNAGCTVRVRRARGNNLKNIDVDFPLKVFSCVTGVSGSGKSTLVIDTLYRGLAQKLNRAKDVPAAHDGLDGIEQIDKVIHIDQAPIGRTPRSNPATYTGLFTMIRELFAKLPESQVRGYGPGRYSFNVKGGRCEACQGGGELRIEMHFLPDMYVTCEVCRGQRFNFETLQIEYKNRNISQILELTVKEAAELFSSLPALGHKLKTLEDVGLGYIQLGQNATTLSGGEAQRIKLARELAKRATGRTLYILDEPTTGLHMDDIRNLVEVLNRLVDQGNTVVVIEHNLDVIKQADYIIDLGPEGGDAGGDVVAVGSPEELVKNRRSATGGFLKKVLRKRR